MGDYDRILVSVDGSEIAGRAVEKAIALAKISGGTVDLLYVANMTGATGGSHLKNEISLPTSVLDTFKEAGNVVLERMKQKMPPEVAIQTHCVTGLPAETILRFSETHESSIIIIGSRGLNPAQSMLLGSVSQYLVERAKCPVMIVK